MPEGIYAAAAGMAAQQAQLDSLSNDVANVNTTGYKQERVGFRDLVYSAEQGVPIGAGAASVDVGRSFSQGALQDTGDPLNVALMGPGFLQVRRADGSTALTRDGSLGLDANGAIVTSSGERVIPPLTVPKGTDPASISISASGAVTVGATSVGRLSIVDVPAPGALLAAGNNLFTPNASSGAPTAVTGTTVQQGSLEGSNVDLASAMVNMIAAQRGYELASRAIKTQDQLLDDANQLVR
jgi:flagellar basal-body rod protein FlgG